MFTQILDDPGLWAVAKSFDTPEMRAIFQSLATPGMRTLAQKFTGLEKQLEAARCAAPGCIGGRPALSSLIAPPRRAPDWPAASTAERSTRLTKPQQKSCLRAHLRAEAALPVPHAQSKEGHFKIVQMLHPELHHSLFDEIWREVFPKAGGHPWSKPGRRPVKSQ